MAAWCPICVTPFDPSPAAAQTFCCSPRCFRALMLQPDTTRSLLLCIGTALRMLDAGMPGVGDLLRDALQGLGGAVRVGPGRHWPHEPQQCVMGLATQRCVYCERTMDPTDAPQPRTPVPTGRKS